MHSFDDLSPEERKRIKEQNREVWRERWFGSRHNEPYQPEPYRPSSKIKTFCAMVFEIGMKLAALAGVMYVVSKIINSCQ